MSDSYLLFVPKDPRFIPEQSAMDAAKDCIEEIRRVPRRHFAGINYVEHYICEDVELFNGMEKFTISSCLHCKSNITDWWDENKNTR